MNRTPMLRSVICIAVVTPPILMIGAERDHGDRDQREQHRDKRRQEIEDLIDMRRQHVFLGKQLDDVGQRLQQSVRTNAPRTDAKLDVRDDLALDPLQIGQRRHQHKHNDRPS